MSDPYAQKHPESSAQLPQQAGYPGYQQPGGYQAPTQQMPYPGGYPGQQQPQKSFLVTWLLSLLLGVFGVDRFYLGKVGTGIVKLITVGGLGVWWLVDLIIVLSGKQTDKQRRPLEGYDRHKKIALIVTLAWVVLGIIINSVNGVPGSSNASNPAPAASQSQAPAAAENPAATTPSAAPVKTPEPEPTPEPAATLATQSFSGTGDDVVTADLAGRPAIITFTCDLCSSNTVLETNGRDSLLVNEIGAYSGRHLVDTRSGSITSEFVISATGDWALTVEDITVITPSAGQAIGNGDDVVAFAGDTTKASIIYSGESNFVIQVYGDRNDLAVNTIGAYEGTVPLKTPAFVQVTASGPWTITAE